MAMGQQIGEGYITIRPEVDKSQFNKTASDAGKNAGTSSGTSYVKSFADNLKKGKPAAQSAAKQSGEDAGEASGSGFGNKLTSMGPMLASGVAAVGVAVGAALIGSFKSAIESEDVTAMLKGKFGLTPQESQSNGALAGKLWAQGFGESTGDVGEASALISRLTDVSGPALEAITKQGLTLSKVFGYDLTDSVNAAKNMVAQGLVPDVQSGFDLIAKASQVGLDANGDLLDSLNEYSSQWSKLGIDGPMAIDLMSQAQKAGIKDTDLLNDAFKEFSIRAVDGSKTTSSAYKSLGLDAKATAKAIAAGGPSAKKATADVIKGIQGIKDPVKQSQVAVELFGTQFEDMGPKIFDSLDLASGEFKDTAGTVDGIAKDLNSTTGAKFEQLKRKVMGFSSAVGGDLLSGFESIGKKVGPVLDNLRALWNGKSGDAGPFGQVKPLIESFKKLGGTFKEIFSDISKVIVDNKAQFATLGNFLIGLFRVIFAVLGPILKALGAAIKAVVGILSGLIQFFSGVFTGNWKKAGDGLHKIWFSLWEGIKGILNNVAKALLSALLTLWGMIGDSVINFGKWVGGLFVSLWNGIKFVFWGFIHWFTDGWAEMFRSAGAAITTAITFITGLWNTLWGGIKTAFWNEINGIKIIWSAVWTFISDTINYWVGLISAAWNAFWATLKAGIQFYIDLIKGIWSAVWTFIKDKIDYFVGLVRYIWDSFWGGIKKTAEDRMNNFKTNIRTIIDNIKGFFVGMKDKVVDLFTKMGDKIVSFKDRAVDAFGKAKDGIKKIWDKLKDVAKNPVNFIIDPVYANIRNLWNTIASKVGLKELPEIKKFARGGVAPGSGNKDTVPAMLTPGEGILTTDEMKKIGGPAGFADLRKQIQYFKDGGIVGWVKDKVGGAVRGAIYPGAKTIADKFIYPLINGMQGGQGFDGLLKASATKIMNKTMSWIKGDDKKHPTATGGMGWKKQMELLHSKFPGLALISGFRPGSKTLSGNQSYHALGRAVDVGPRRDVAQWIRSNFMKQTKELISPYNDLNIWNGQPHKYTGAIWNQHNFAGGNAHDHWAMDGISQRPPGWFMGYNGTGKTETLINKDKIDGGNVYNVYLTVNADQLSDMQKVVAVFKDIEQAANSGYIGV